MNKKFKARLSDRIMACLALLFAAALIALWITIILFGIDPIPVRTSIKIGKLVFFLIVGVPIYRVFKKGRYYRAVLRTIATCRHRVAARPVTKAKYDAYKMRKYKENHKPYFETRF